MNWISPNKALPGDSIRVLAIVNDKDGLFTNHIRIVRYRQDRNKWTTPGFRLKEVLFWMELPAPPK